MTTICLIRHGQTDWNKAGRIQGETDTVLNNTGKQQASGARDALEKSDWDLIVTSPLKRTKQTAEIINEKLQLPLIEMEAFKERGYGDAEGLTKEEREAKFPDMRTYPNQESREAVTARVTQGIEEILAAYPNKKILLVSHGGAINAILANVSGGEIGTGKTKLHNACLSNIGHDGEMWTVKDYNQVEHLVEME